MVKTVTPHCFSKKAQLCPDVSWLLFVVFSLYHRGACTAASTAAEASHSLGATQSGRQPEFCHLWRCQATRGGDLKTNHKRLKTRGRGSGGREEKGGVWGQINQI